MLTDSSPTQGRPSIPGLMQQAYVNDPQPGMILAAIETNRVLKKIIISDGILQRVILQSGGIVYVPGSAALPSSLIQECHDKVLAVHSGKCNTFEFLSWRYYWKSLPKDVYQYVRNCHSFQHMRYTQHSTDVLFQPLQVLNIPSAARSMDFVDWLPEYEVFNTLSIIVDSISKMRHYVPWHTTIESPWLGELFFTEVVCLHGLPPRINLDRGSQFASTLWGPMCSYLGIDERMSMAFHRKTAYLTESVNANMEQYCSVFVNHQQDDSVKWLAMAVFAANHEISENNQ